MVGVTIMVGAATGVEVSGLVLDGVGDGVDGVRGGGVLRSIRTTHHPLL